MSPQLPGAKAPCGAAPAPVSWRNRGSFGSSLASADFDGQLGCDLAIGVPGETIDPVVFAHGTVNILLSAGLVFADNFERGDISVWSSTSR